MKISRTKSDFIGIIALATGLMVYMGWCTDYFSPTGDEAIDLRLLQCLFDGGGLLACNDDITQFRMIFLLPLWVMQLIGSTDVAQVTHWESAFFTAATLPVLFCSVKKVSNANYAWLAALVFCTHPSLLNAGVIVLTHSMSVLMFFTTLATFAFLQYREKDHLRNFLFLVVALALAFSASMVSLFVMPAFAVGIFMVRRPPLSWLLTGAVLFAGIFAAFNFYLFTADNFQLFRKELAEAGIIEYWNYLGLGRSSPPWYFGIVVLFIRFMPTFTLLLLLSLFGRGRREPLVWMALTILLFNWVKVVFFHYDAPHHQWYYYPFFLVLIFKWLYGLKTKLKAAGVALVVASCAWGLYDTVLLYPNLLFYGARYGDRVIGEFYGPAVIQCQNSEVAKAFLNRDDPEQQRKVLYLEGSSIHRIDHERVSFVPGRTDTLPYYALSDRVCFHLNFANKEAYQAFLQKHYDIIYQYDFAYEKWAYRVHRRKGAGVGQ